nr:fimbria/pilus periplasmic chaperone [uncultured Hyphomonas sp.]
MWLFRRALLVVLAFTAPAISAGADGKLQIQPIRGEIEQGKPGSLTLINHADTHTHLEATAFEWGQDETGKDILKPTTDLIITPPIMKIEPGGRQILRFAVRYTSEPPPIQELTYRIILEEVPVVGEQQEGLSLLLRYSVPVFVSGEYQTTGDVEVRLVDGADRCQVEIRNNRALHVNLERLTVYAGQNAQDVKVPLYLLPNARLKLACPEEVSGGGGYDKAVLASDVEEFPAVLDRSSAVSGLACAGGCPEE